MISVTALQQNSKTIYVGLLSTLTVFLLMDYIPVLASFSQSNNFVFCYRFD